MGRLVSPGWSGCAVELSACCEAGLCTATGTPEALLGWSKRLPARRMSHTAAFDARVPGAHAGGLTVAPFGLLIDV
ncbi:MAG: hypothetical protein AAGG72_00410 [Pseudomonadota bacterium]